MRRLCPGLAFSVAATACAILFAPAPALADSAEGSHVTATPLGVRGKANGPIELLSLSLTVSYADLDLTRPAGLRELERRVRLAARSACDEITFEYPEAFFPPTPRSEHCEQDAVASAMSQVRGIIAARGGQTWLATGEPTR